MRVFAAALVPLALLAGCASPSTPVPPARAFSAEQSARYEDPSGALEPASLLPYGDGQGGFVWLDGHPIAEDRGLVRADEGGGAWAVDLSYRVGMALDTMPDVATWAAAARVAFRNETRTLDSNAVAQAIDRAVLAKALRTNNDAADRVALDALERLAHAGAPEAGLALHAKARLAGRVQSSALHASCARLARNTRAWLERPFRPMRTPRVVTGDTLDPKVARQLAELEARFDGIDAQADLYRRGERARLWEAVVSLES